MRRSWLVVFLFSFLSATIFAGSTVSDLRAEVEKMRRELNANDDARHAPISRVDERITGKFGPDQRVTTKEGALKIRGLMQVWYQSVQNDNLGIVRESLGFNPDPLVDKETNELNDNDTFRIRRSEIWFDMRIHENVRAVVVLDPARESNPSFSPLPTFPRHNSPTGNLPAAQSGQYLRGLAGGVLIPDARPRLLQDAILYFNYLPKHVVSIGQFKPPAGEEAWRNSGTLDFVERAMVTGINNVRDTGVMVTGSWWNDRINYSVGVFNGPAGSILSDPEIQEAGNRSDDNDEKDLAMRFLIRPVWTSKKWHGFLEFGFHRTDGIHGESGQEFDADFNLNAMNITRTDVARMGAWAFYTPMGPARGFWMRGEWGMGRDRYGPGASYTNLLGIGGSDLGIPSARNPGFFTFTQVRPAPVNVQGWYFSSGYRLFDSRFAEKLKNGNVFERALHNMEFAFRYEVYQNVALEDLVDPLRHTDQFKTQVWTAGVNYYIKRGAFDTKLQANYLIVDDPSSGNSARGLREVRNDVFVVNFQVAF